jgi:hypothetical protein
MHRNGTNERPVATHETATQKYGPPALAALVAGSTKTVPVPSSRDALERRAAKVPPSCSRLPAGSRPCHLVEVFQNARPLF